MPITFAVIKVTDGASPVRPVVLSELLFKPVLAWMIDGLKSAGVEKFYLLCRPEDRERTLGCVPPDTDCVLYTGEEEELGDNSDGIVLTRPVVLTARELTGILNFAGSYGIPAVSLTDEDAAALGAYYLSNVTPGWVLTRLDSGDSLSSALELEGVALAQLKDNGDAICLYDFKSLHTTQEVLRRAIVEQHMEKGVCFVDPDSAYVGPEVQLGAGTVVLPQVILRGRVEVGPDCRLGPNAMLTNTRVGEGTEINASQLVDSEVGSFVKVGPFAYLRPGCRVADRVKVGDFVELKNAQVGEGTKVPHLSYVGDATLGAGVNIGCGAITVNYDGKLKTRTVVGDGAFIGCNSNLVAPVEVGRGAYTAAGSTITEDVPENALAIGRARQTVKEDWAKRRREQGRLK